MAIKKKLLKEAIKSAYTNIPVATQTQNGLASADMAIRLGAGMVVESKSFLRITQLKKGWLREFCTINFLPGISWDKVAPVQLLIGLVGENAIQGVKPVLVNGNANIVKIFKGIDNYLYLQSIYSADGVAYVSMSSTKNSLELQTFTEAPTEMTEVPII